jgi:hypothetical protein
MKRTFLSILTVIVCLAVFSRCATDEILMPEQVEKANFPAYIEEYGETLAKELRQTVYNMNKMGVNYSDAENTPEFKERFYNDLYNATPRKTRSNISKDQIGLSPEAFAEGYRNLTAIQIEFIKRIIDEGQKTSSYDELFNVLMNINKDIYVQVPAIEQERLLRTTAVLYYGLKEIQRLEQQGQMFVTPMNSMMGFPILKTRSENDGGSSGGGGGSCRAFLATAWTIAVGEPTLAGEIVMAIVTVGYLLYEITVCSDTSSDSDSDYDYCQDKFASCIPMYGFQDPCSQCLQHCLKDGVWPGQTMGCK